MYKDNNRDCPHCRKNLQGDEIPEESQHLYGATHFSKVIGEYSTELDATIKLRCPDCNGVVWERGKGYV